MNMKESINSPNTMIIFIHGFTGSKYTWVDREENPKGLLKYLLDDENLKDNFNYALFDYDTSVLPNNRLISLFKTYLLKFNSKISLPISKLARNLKTNIEDRCDGYDNIVLVGHSLGGLVAKKYINDNLNSKSGKKIKLFITLATPHLGADIANFSNLVFENPQAIDMKVLGSTINELTESWLEKENLPQRIYFTALKDQVVTFGGCGFERNKITVKDTMSNHSTIINPPSSNEDVVIGMKNVLNDFFKKINEGLISKTIKDKINDINVNAHYKVTENLKDVLNDIDCTFNSLIGTVSSPRHNHIKQQFKSNKIIQSLAVMGVPIDAGLSVLSRITPILTDIHASGTNITTFHIRKAVSKTLFELDSAEYSRQTIQNWGTSYARRYGNPDIRIRVQNSNGSEEAIDYKYIKTSIIPQIIEKCYEKNYEEINKAMNINSSAGEMSEEIFEKLKNLGLYSVYIKTVLNLAYDIATQPPQPWFVNSKYKTKNIKYDLDRAERHFEIISKSEEDTVVDEIHHSAVDCIDHICSAILTKYDLFIGAGRLKPLNSLYNFLNIFNENTGNKVLWEVSSLTNIDGDLHTSNLTLSDMTRRLKKHMELLGNRNKNIKPLIKSSKEIYTIGLDLVDKENYARKLEKKLRKDISVYELKQGVRYYFSLLNHCKEYDESDSELLTFYYKFSDSAFNHINNKFRVLPIISYKDLNNDFAGWIESQNIFSRRTNTLFIITKVKDSLINEHLLRYEENNIEVNIYIFQVEDLFKLAFVKDRESFLFDKIANNER